jgi:hypothetical protein
MERRKKNGGLAATANPEPATRKPFDRTLLAQCRIERLMLRRLIVPLPGIRSPGAKTRVTGADAAADRLGRAGFAFDLVEGRVCRDPLTFCCLFGWSHHAPHAWGSSCGEESRWPTAARRSS